MTPSLDRILEGVLLAAGEPLTIERLEVVFDDAERPGRRALREALATLGERLEDSALVLEETASGFRLRVRDALSPWVSRLWDERPQRYSRALLETLALIAYRQPVTRPDIEEVRGVSVSASIMRTLVERGWVRVAGHRDVPGRPAVYATTRSFLDDFGLRTLDELPPISAVKEGETVDWLEQLTPGAPSAETVEASNASATTEDSLPDNEDAASESIANEGMATEHAVDSDSSNTADGPADSPEGAPAPSPHSSIEAPTPAGQSPSLDEIGQRLAERLRDRPSHDRPGHDRPDRDRPDTGLDERSTHTSDPED
ncbi:SMC-Scp complex subunit ScpB [Kushneria sp. AK178]